MMALCNATDIGASLINAVVRSLPQTAYKLSRQDR